MQLELGALGGSSQGAVDLGPGGDRKQKLSVWKRGRRHAKHGRSLPLGFISVATVGTVSSGSSEENLIRCEEFVQSQALFSNPTPGPQGKSPLSSLHPSEDRIEKAYPLRGSNGTPTVLA